MKILKFLFLLHGYFYFCFISQAVFADDANAKGDTLLELPEFVAHGGGAIYDRAQTNSLEALNYSYKKGFRFFELDFEWTADEKMFLIHDWKCYIEALFSAEEKIYTEQEVRKLKMINNLTPLFIDDLVAWMISHPDAYVITDIKRDNIRGLKEISTNYSTVRANFIPQIYSFEEYQEVKKMGFKNIILTLYLSNYTNEEVIDFLTHSKVFALTIPDDRVTKKFVKELNKLKIFTFVHTVNDIKLKNELAELGVDGFYTDLLFFKSHNFKAHN